MNETAGNRTGGAEPIILQASAIAIGRRALALIGPPGSGKSSLALALIDRGAVLIGDDAVTLSRKGKAIEVAPPPNITGLIEIRGVGLFEVPTAQATPLSLVLDLGATAERLPSAIPTRAFFGLAIPCLPFAPGGIAPAVRAEWALAKHGLPLS